MKSWFVIGTMLLATFLVGTASGYFLRDDISQLEASIFPNAERRARDVLLASLVDPDSLQLRNTRFVGDLVCGEMNSRNRMGGYVGFRQFVVLPDAGLASIVTIDAFEEAQRPYWQTILDDFARIDFLIDPTADEPSRYDGRAEWREWQQQVVLFVELWERCGATR
jgi:hypothetical protein